MGESFDNLPPRIEPYIAIEKLNQKIPVSAGPLRLIGSTEGVLESGLVFRWYPTSAIEFDGVYDQPHPSIENSDWSLESQDDEVFSSVFARIVSANQRISKLL